MSTTIYSSATIGSNEVNTTNTQLHGMLTGDVKAATKLEGWEAFKNFFIKLLNHLPGMSIADKETKLHEIYKIIYDGKETNDPKSLGTVWQAITNLIELIDSDKAYGMEFVFDERAVDHHDNRSGSKQLTLSITIDGQKLPDIVLPNNALDDNEFKLITSNYLRPKVESEGLTYEKTYKLNPESFYQNNNRLSITHKDCNDDFDINHELGLDESQLLSSSYSSIKTDIMSDANKLSEKWNSTLNSWVSEGYERPNSNELESDITALEKLSGRTMSSANSDQLTDIQIQLNLTSQLATLSESISQEKVFPIEQFNKVKEEMENTNNHPLNKFIEAFWNKLTDKHRFAIGQAVLKKSTDDATKAERSKLEKYELILSDFLKGTNHSATDELKKIPNFPTFQSSQNNPMINNSSLKGREEQISRQKDAIIYLEKELPEIKSFLEQKNTKFILPNQENIISRLRTKNNLLPESQKKTFYQDEINKLNTKIIEFNVSSLERIIGKTPADNIDAKKSHSNILSLLDNLKKNVALEAKEERLTKLQSTSLTAQINKLVDQQIEAYEIEKVLFFYEVKMDKEDKNQLQKGLTEKINRLTDCERKVTIQEQVNLKFINHDASDLSKDISSISLYDKVYTPKTEQDLASIKERAHKLPDNQAKARLLKNIPPIEVRLSLIQNIEQPFTEFRKLLTQSQENENTESWQQLLTQFERTTSTFSDVLKLSPQSVRTQDYSTRFYEDAPALLTQLNQKIAACSGKEKGLKKCYISLREKTISLLNLPKDHNLEKQLKAVEEVKKAVKKAVKEAGNFPDTSKMKKIISWMTATPATT